MVRRWIAGLVVDVRDAQVALDGLVRILDACRRTGGALVAARSPASSLTWAAPVIDELVEAATMGGDMAEAVERALERLVRVLDEIVELAVEVGLVDDVGAA